MGLIIHVDGGSRGNPGPSGAGIVIETDDGRLLHEAAYFLGRQTNNTAEYHGLLRALARAAQLNIQPVCVYSDSQLLVRQVTGEYEVKSPRLTQLYQQVQMILLRMPGWSIRHIKREENRRADDLANLAMDEQRDVIICDVADPSSAPLVPPSVTAELQAGAAPPETPEDMQPPPEAAGRHAVQVVLAQPPNSDVCPAAGAPPEDFTVAATLPADLCVHAAHAILPTLLAMLNTEPQEFAGVPTLTVRCPRPGCGAVFRLSPVRGSNGKKRRPRRKK